MGATSVTGVGLGSASGKNKGTSRTSMGVERLIGPRVVVADTLTLNGTGSGIVNLPVLPGSLTDYIVNVTSASASTTAVVGILSAGPGSTIITITGVANGVVAYSVIKKGLAV